MISKNEKRRKHLTAKQKAFVGARIANLSRGGDGSNQYQRANSPNGDFANSISISRACKIIGATERQISRAIQILNSGNEEIREKVEGGRGGYFLRLREGALLKCRSARAWGRLFPNGKQTFSDTSLPRAWGNMFNALKFPSAHRSLHARVGATEGTRAPGSPRPVSPRLVLP